MNDDNKKLMMGILGTLGFGALCGVCSYSESRTRSEIKEINSCVVDGRDYILLDKLHSREIYVRQDDGKYVLLDDKLRVEFKGEREDLIKNIRNLAIPNLMEEGR